MEGEPCDTKLIFPKSLGSAREPGWKGAGGSQIVHSFFHSIKAPWAPTRGQALIQGLEVQARQAPRSLDFIPSQRKLIFKASALPFLNCMKLTSLNFCSSSVNDTQIRGVGKTE